MGMGSEYEDVINNNSKKAETREQRYIERTMEQERRSATLLNSHQEKHNKQKTSERVEDDRGVVPNPIPPEVLFTPSSPIHPASYPERRTGAHKAPPEG